MFSMTGKAESSFMGNRERDLRATMPTLGKLPEAMLAQRDLLAQKFYEESPLKNKVAKTNLTKLLASQILHHEILIELMITGQLASEEARGLSGCASGIMRLAKELGLTLHKDDGGFSFDLEDGTDGD